MKNHSPHLRIIGQLAQEYDQKYRELEKLLSEISPELVIPQLRALAERTTDNFRSGQVALLSLPETLDEKGAEQFLQAVTGISRAFDEMRILFQFAVEKIRQDEEKG